MTSLCIVRLDNVLEAVTKKRPVPLDSVAEALSWARLDDVQAGLEKSRSCQAYSIRSYLEAGRFHR